MTVVSEALDSLLPSYTYPAKLTSQANSLLAQSRLRAPNLKPEEEIARSYACAEIACNRSRVQLRLPASVKSRPPCKPAVYKKLLAFLEGVLIAQKRDAGEQASSTPKRRAADGVVNGAAVTSTAPSSASRRKDVFIGRVEAARDNQSTTEAPELVMPLVRKLCKAFATPQLPPHVYTGVCVVLKLAEMWPLEGRGDAAANDFKTNTSTLVIAVYLLVLTRMQIGNMTPDAYIWRCARAVEIAGLDNSEKGEEMIGAWIKRLDTEGWCEGQEWFSSVPESVMKVRDAADARDVDGEDAAFIDTMKRKGRNALALEVDEDDPEGVLQPGLGTMMQDAVMWLSSDRKSDYLAWKESMLNRIRVIERREGRRVAVR